MVQQLEHTVLEQLLTKVVWVQIPDFPGKDQDNGQKSSLAEVFVKSELRIRLLECFSFLLQFPAFPPSTTDSFNTLRITWN